MLNKKEINSLAIPAILYNITEPLIGLADTAIIGQMECNPTIAQGGVGLAAALIATLVWGFAQMRTCLLYTSPSPRDCLLSRMPSSA